MLLPVCVLSRPGRERWPAALQAKQTPNSPRMRSEAIKILMPPSQTPHRWVKVCKRERSLTPPWIDGAHWRTWMLLWLLNRKQSQWYTMRSVFCFEHHSLHNYTACLGINKNISFNKISIYWTNTLKETSKALYVHISHIYYVKTRLI